MIDDSIRNAFESIDGDATDEFRELLRRRCLADFAAGTRPGRSATDEQFLPVKEMSMSIDSPTSGTSNRRHLLLAAAAVVVVLGIAGVSLANRNSDDQTPSTPAAPTAAPPTTITASGTREPIRSQATLLPASGPRLPNHTSSSGSSTSTAPAS